MTNYIKTGILSLLALPLSNITLAQEGNKKNLLFIITDQQRYDALSYAGNTVLKTPNLDRLAKQGAYFQNAYTPCAVCGPARSSILTGSIVEHTGVVSNNETYYYEGEGIMTMPTFDEILSENGYHCEYYGKWHAMSKRANIYKNPVQTADNGNSVFGPGGQSYIWRDYLDLLGPVPEPGAGQFKEDISKYPYTANPLDHFYGMSYEALVASGQKHSQPDQHGVLQLNESHTMTAFQARQTLEAIERLKDSTFSITCAFHFPHTPMVVPEPYYSLYPVADMIPPVSINDNMANSPYASSNSRNTRTEYADPEKIKYMISEYYGIITEIDDWIGLMLDKLDELGIADNTMIIFTSDHGEMLGAHGMREKNIFLNESAHIPLLISSPGDVQPETTVDGYISLIDLFPTILDYLEVPAVESDGKSLRGLIEGTDTEHGQYTVTEWDRENTPNYMVIKDGWKLIIPYTIKSTVINAMYDLNTDPYEMNNLLGSNPARANYKAQAEELRACLLEWLAERNSVHYYSVSKRDLMEGGKATGNNAAFVSQIVPELKAGETISISITMKNTGTTAWTPTGQFKLGSQSPADNEIWGIQRVNLDPGDSIVNGGEKTFQFEVTVPQNDGVYNFQWQMIQEGEEWFGAKSEIKQFVSGNPGSFMDDCDVTTNWKSSSSLIRNTTNQQQGSACIEFYASGTDEFKKVFSPAYNSWGSEENTVLRFWYYISDISLFESSNQVELGSSGKADENEYNWNLSNLTNGWNYLVLKTSEATKMGSPNLNAINWFRIYHKKTGIIKTRIDAIQLIDTNVGPLYTLLVTRGSGGGDYPAGVNVNISAQAASTGTIFDKWIIESGNPAIADVLSPSTTVILGEGSASITATYKSTVSVESLKINDSSVEIYPNPAKDEFSIHLKLEKSSELNISLLDLSGRKVGKEIRNLQVNKGQTEVYLPVSEIMPGTYICKVSINSSSFSRLLIIQ
ncbi:MAG: sulfatase-like hydrolase/transferase [Bacteroidales bacterium]|nr:sulfatase-like hydrolase/transferase [Bacteroidales bacterium]MCF8391395.1 sulfatase-like hydrolase/transferase [Bacteroidales bacterium]